MDNPIKTEEEKRLDEANSGKALWRLWGPYLSERQWGTVREDYSPDGDAWGHFPHDHARSRAYRWGEEGIAGISDEKQQLCFALALWNGQDPILKERLFGLTNKEGNHGEDVKEYYFYLDNIPSHAYMKYLYKYPQGAFPYNDLVATNGRRTREELEYELLDTGIFNEDRYYDVFIEYAKAAPEEILIQFSIANRGPESASLHLFPTLWFRNTWSWEKGTEKPLMMLAGKKNAMQVLKASHPSMGNFWLYSDCPDSILFTENETNKQKLFNSPNDSPYVKDGINEYFVHGRKDAVNSENQGTKAAVHYNLQIGAGETKIVKLRLSKIENSSDPFGKEFDDTFAQRKKDADTFYQRVTPYPISDDMRNVQRQAFAGLLWNKQCYHYNVKTWLKGDPAGPCPPEERKYGRNHHWQNLDAYDVISMPDKWEFPWLAAWDLSFHTASLAMIDPEFAKNQLILLTREWYMSPDGQLPAYEWGFGDVNPPLQVWAALHVYHLENIIYGRKDRGFLERIFQKLVINFTWWVNRKDATGHNIFEGGFLGLDNIGAFDRTRGPPNGGILEQCDGTGWMGMYCLKLLEISLELASEDPVYEDMATKFFEHFVDIADAINNVTGQIEGLWDEEKGFYYSLLVTPDGKRLRMSQNSLTGIVPLFAIGINESDKITKFTSYRERFYWFIKNRKKMLHTIADFRKSGGKEHILLAFANSMKLSSILKLILDEDRFLSPYGIRSVSKRYAHEPFTIRFEEQEFKLDYEPAESKTNLFGGNSNWRGPIWFPLNYLLIESLKKFYYYYGDDFKVECPQGSGKMANLCEVSTELSNRLINIFLKDKNGLRPVYGAIEKFQNDPHWRDYILFHEYFNGDNGAGLGASNQTGWTGLVANLIHQQGELIMFKLH
jgi:Glycosyl hydrolase family 63 C-terminal domain